MPACADVRSARIATLLLTAVFHAPLASAAELTPASQRSYRPYPPTELTSYVFEQPRPIRAWTVRVDLTSPDIEFVATCGGENLEGNLETRSATTLEFAESEHTQIAINASPFSPLRETSGEGMDVVGLGACNGNVYSAPDERYGALVVTRDGRVEIWAPPYAADQLARVDDATGGFHVLVDDGVSVAARAAAATSPKFADVNPRTAVGLSADGKTLWLIVVDGRNRGRSEGMTLAELADFGISLKCHALLNLDGGGSSTLVVQDPASRAQRVVNQPVGRGPLDTLRLVGNNFGLRVRTDAAQSVPPSPTSAP